MVMNKAVADGYTENTSKLNRRQFLTRLGSYSAAGWLLGSAAARGAELANLQVVTKDETTVEETTAPLSNPVVKVSQCVLPTVETRLFGSSNVSSDVVRNKRALLRLACAGFDIKNPEIVNRQYLRFAGTDRQRASDLQNIATGGIAAPKLLMGVGGGYGAMRLLPLIDWSALGRVLKDHGTILAGFSDVTAIQCALLANGGMSSLAAPMLNSEFGKVTPDSNTIRQFVTALTAPKLTINVQKPDLTAKSLPMILAKNPEQVIQGTIWGGNLSVVSALAGSEFLPKIDGGIVFLEEVGETPYRVERMLYDLYLAGAFKSQQAIVFGALSGFSKDAYDPRYDMAVVIQQLFELTKLPIYSGFGFGHIANKQSFPLGAECQIKPLALDSKLGFSLSFTHYPTITPNLISAEGLLLSS